MIRFFSRKISSSFDIPSVERAINKGDLSKNFVEWHLKSAYISIKISKIRSGILYSIDLCPLDFLASQILFINKEVVEI
jgi:hypothetical protein